VALEAAVKFFVYASALLMLGAVAAHWIVPPRVGGAVGVESRLRRLAIIASALLIATLGARTVAHSISAFGWTDGWSLDSLEVIALRSQWGRAWQRQVFVAAIALAAILGARTRATRIVATVTAALAVAALALTGHAEGEPARLLVHVVHLIAAGTWLGTLAVLCVAWRALPGAAMTTTLRRFSPVALTSAGLLALSGLTAAYLYLGSPANLWSTAYGRLLSAKLVVLCGVLACGFANWRRVRSEHAPVRRVVALEVIFATAIVAVTAWLTETGHP